ncbi:DNA-binding SARP family transcriptional activator/ActR/RegA family two-component response regulator [Arthrobacter sp. CAN_A2]|uniref:BTAD domain-containing putative transcriptional regulator n=1 Tax=Arthrobacter sp. CAN_A2 TaxID=2787718 RepID=UPI001A26BA62
MITLNVAEEAAVSTVRARADADMSKLDISILGPLTVRRGGIELNAGDIGGPKPRQVLEILLLNFGSAVPKTRIMDLLWGDKQPAAALPTLESYVSVLRRGLQPGAGRTGPLRTVAGGYVIERSLVDLDLDRFEALTSHAEAAPPHAALELFVGALDLASAPLFGDEVLPAWAEDERILHAERVRLARIIAAEKALLVGEEGRAITWSEMAVKEDPLDERAWKALILGLEGNGEATAALRAFERCRRVLLDELGCGPSAPLKEAHARLLARTAPRVEASSGGSLNTAMEGRSLESPTPSQGGERLSILIVDDHTTFSDLLAGALDREPDFRSIGAATTVDEAATMFRELRPDVVVMDLYLADGSGLNAAERILAEAPQARIVMLTGNPSQEALREAARMGICGFLPKDGSLGVMLDTLRHARPGNMIVHPSLVVRLGNAVGPSRDHAET